MRDHHEIYDDEDPDGGEAWPDQPDQNASPRKAPAAGPGMGMPFFLALLALISLFVAYSEGKRRGSIDPEGGDPESLSAVTRETTDTPAARTGSPAWVGNRVIDPVLVNDVYNRSRKLIPMATRLGPAKPGEWRHIAHETTQSYYQFARDPRRPSFEGARRSVIIQPLGDLSAPSARLLPLIGEFLSCYLDMPTQVASPLPARSLPDTAWRRQGSHVQLDAEYTMANVLAPRLPSNGAIIVGLTGADLRPGDRWSFQNAFGWSSFHARTAIVSFARSFPGNERREASLPDLTHILKFVAHEASHALGMLHCDRYACLVNGRASLQENAIKPLWLCPDCYAKMALATGFNGTRRARRLAEFCGRHGLEAERKYWAAVAAAAP